jgi:predicted DNA-binding transcriptional regulator AlpA
METLFIPNENDFKRWIKEAMKEYFQYSLQKEKNLAQKEDDLLNRKEIAKFLRISLVTLNDWMKRGLPSHKQRGRVYFMKSEVLDYIKETKMKQLKFGSRFQMLNKDIA